MLTLAGHSCRSTLLHMVGTFKRPLAQEHRAVAGVVASQQVEVELTLDTEPRVVPVPQDLTLALQAAGLGAQFDDLSCAHRKEHVRALEEAQTAETWALRIAKALGTLAER